MLQGTLPVSACTSSLDAPFGTSEMQPVREPCPTCGSRWHAIGACMEVDVEALIVEEKKKLVRDYSKIKVPAGCTLLDMIRPVREAVPNATVRLPKKIIDSDLTCAICMNVICEAMTITDCLHRFCSDCISQSLRLSKRECPSCRTPVTRHQLVRDTDFDLIITKMYSDVSTLRDLQDIKAAEFCTSDNIKVISEDLKERLEQQVQLTAAGGRTLTDSPSNAPEAGVVEIVSAPKSVGKCLCIICVLSDRDTLSKVSTHLHFPPLEMR